MEIDSPFVHVTWVRSEFGPHSIGLYLTKLEPMVHACGGDGATRLFAQTALS